MPAATKRQANSSNSSPSDGICCAGPASQSIIPSTVSCFGRSAMARSTTAPVGKYRGSRLAAGSRSPSAICISDFQCAGAVKTVPRIVTRLQRRTITGFFACHFVVSQTVMRSLPPTELVTRRRLCMLVRLQALLPHDLWGSFTRHIGATWVHTDSCVRSRG